MKKSVSLTISNIGGILGEKQILISKNALNVIEGPNASGKSSVAKGLIAVLGIDNRVLHPSSYNRIWMIEARNLGILPEQGGHRAGILHADAEKGEVTLEEDNIKRRLIIESSGKIYPDSNANSNFLLVGVLTPNSWLYSAISRPGDMRNESIFKNYITKLSAKADKYEQAGSILQEYYSKLHKLQNEIKRRKAMIPTLKREIESLKKELSDLRQKRDELMAMIGTEKEHKKQKIAHIKIKLEKLEKEKDEIKEEIRKYKASKRSLENDIKNLEAEIETLSRKIEEIQKRRSQIEDELSNPPDIKAIEAEISMLQEKRSRLQALADLYYVALDNIDENREASVCPLCGVGELNIGHIRKHLQETKEEISKIEKKLRELVTKKTQTERYLQNLNQELSQLEKEEKRTRNLLKDRKNSLQAIRGELPGINTELDILENRLKKIEVKISEYKELLRKENPELISELDKLSRKIEEKEKLLEKKQSQYTTMGYIELEGISLDLDVAQRITEQLTREFLEGYRYSHNQAERVRQEAIKQFNTMVNDVLKRIGFSEFKKIYLDRDYILNVKYVSPDGDIKIIQPHALSESERVAIALVLMLALNKVYRENIGYIVIDNMYEYFDQYRTNEVLKLLAEYARQENVTIVLTRTVLTEGDLKVSILE